MHATGSACPIAAHFGGEWIITLRRRILRIDSTPDEMVLTPQLRGVAGGADAVWASRPAGGLARFHPR